MRRSPDSRRLMRPFAFLRGIHPAARGPLWRPCRPTARRLAQSRGGIMRKATLVGTLIATMLVFGLMLVPVVGASKTDAPLFQATETPTTGAATAEPTEAATAEATAAATEAATAAATSAATSAPATTATTAPGQLPNTGGDSGMGLILLGA